MSTPPSKRPESRSMRSQATSIAGNADESMRIVQELEAAVESLRTRYEQFFLGLARVPPTEEHQRIRSDLVRLRAAPPRSAPVRFRLQTLHNRFLSYERMWARVVREREDGTYHRDVERARMSRRAAAAPARTEPAAGASSKTSEADEQVASVAATDGMAPGPRVPGASTGAPAPNRAAPSGGAPRSDVSDERLRAVFDAYVGAKQRCGEDTKGLTFEGLAKKLRTQIPELLSRHNASSVELKVVIKGGKAMVKAIPK